MQSKYLVSKSPSQYIEANKNVEEPIGKDGIIARIKDYEYARAHQDAEAVCARLTKKSIIVEAGTGTGRRSVFSSAIAAAIGQKKRVIFPRERKLAGTLMERSTFCKDLPKNQRVARRTLDGFLYRVAKRKTAIRGLEKRDFSRKFVIGRVIETATIEL